MKWNTERTARYDRSKWHGQGYVPLFIDDTVLLMQIEYTVKYNPQCK